MPTKLVNVSLLALTLTLTVSGLLMLVFSVGAGWLFDVHRAAGVGLVALLPWKVGIAWRSIRRRWRTGSGRGVVLGVSLPLAALLLLSVSLVLVWTLNLTPLWGIAGYPALLLHWYAALALLPLFIYHVYYHWYPRPTRGLVNTRRQFLRLSLLTAGALVGWAGLNSVAAVRQSLDQARRFTGSREVGSFAGNAMPVTMLLTDNPAPLDPTTWRLTVDGRVRQPLTLSVADLAAWPQATLTATLDCTNGWYSGQVWRGVRLGDLLDRAGVSTKASLVRVISITGHQVALPLADAAEALLATHITDDVLNHGHGAPLRLAHPGLRGWLWIKWVTRVEVVGAGETI